MARKKRKGGKTVSIPKDRLFSLERSERDLVALQSIVPHTPRYIPPTVAGMGYQKGLTFGARFGGLSHNLLREVATRCLLLQAIHSARTHQVMKFAKRWSGRKGDVGYRIIHESEYDESVKTENIPNVKARCDRVARAFEVPHPIHEPTFQGFCTKLTNDFLTINRPTIEIIPGMPGELPQFGAVDGAIVFPTLHYLKQFSKVDTMFDLDEALSAFYDQKGIDLSGAEWVVVREGILENVVPRGRIVIAPLEITTDIRHVGFPPSYVERAIIGVIAFVNAFSYNAQYFERGMMAEIILGIGGDFSDDEFIAFQDQMREGHSGLDGAWRIPVIRIDDGDQLKQIALKKSNRDMQFKEFINIVMALTCAVYRMHMTAINFSVVREGRVVFEHAQKTEISMAQEEGELTLLSHIMLLLNHVVQKMDPELRVQWVGLDSDQSKEEQGLIATELSTLKSVDELRISQGDKPFDQWWSQVPANPVIFPHVAAEQKIKDLEAQEKARSDLTGSRDFGTVQQDFGTQANGNGKEVSGMNGQNGNGNGKIGLDSDSKEEGQNKPEDIGKSVNIPSISFEDLLTAKFKKERQMREDTIVLFVEG